MPKISCFVIMPFSQTNNNHTEEYWTKHYEKFLKPLIEQYKDIEVDRSKAMRGDILREIISDLINAKIVVAELTDYNPNVFWELGIRQSFRHGTITIAEGGTDLPFDLGTKGTLFYYPNDHLKNAIFMEEFQEALEDCIQHPDRPDSFVLETLTGRGTLFEMTRRDETNRRLDAINSECKYNKDIYADVEKTANNNRKKTEKEDFDFETGRLRSAAIKLLSTNRYIDAKDSFYKFAENYLSRIIEMNDQLNIWEHRPEPTNNWILRDINDHIETLEEFLNEIIKIKEARQNLH